jgi:transposase
MMGLTRQDKEKLVLDLRSQGKTFRQIAKEAQISPLHIKDILNKVEPEEQSMSIPSQAYKLFSEGKTPIEVAIELNERESEVTQYYIEYWKLNQLYNLKQLYDEIKDDDNDIYSLVKLYRLIKSEGMTIQDAVRVLKIANNNDLLSVEHRCQEL